MINHRHYPSISAMLAQSQAPYRFNTNRGQAYDIVKSSRSNKDWFGVDDATGFNECLTLIQLGYPTGAELIEAMTTHVNASLPRAQGHARRVRRGPQGDSLDIHAVLRGDLDHAWTRSVREVKRGSGLVRLIVDIGGNAGMNADQLLWRGVAGASLAHIMGKAGYAVEIWSAFSVKEHTSKDDPFLCTTVVKPTRALADFPQLAATICLPGYFRTLGFLAIVRGADDAKLRVKSNLGHWVDPSPLLPNDGKITQLIVPGSVCDQKTAVKFAQQTIALLQGA